MITLNVINKKVKACYDQRYQNFSSTDMRSGAQFNGFMIEASVGF